jgi:copper/silver efflux system protein
VKTISDLEQIVVKSDRGVPVLLKDVARIELTPDERRGSAAQSRRGRSQRKPPMQSTSK